MVGIRIYFPPKKFLLYIALGVGAAVITFIVFVISRSLMSGIVVALASVVLGVYAARKPETKQYVIDEQGVKIGDKSFSYSDFKSFSIMEEDAVNSVWLRPLKRYSPTTVMYYSPEDEEKIIMMLENFLPEEDRDQDMIEWITRRIRF